jgi:glycogen debranching enzyme
MRNDITRSIVIKEGNLFFLTNAEGFVPLESGHGFGLYYNDCRFLNGYELTVGGQKLRLRASDASCGNKATLEFQTGDSVAIESVRTILGENLTLSDNIRLQNLTNKSLQISLRFALQSRFEDIFAVRGIPQKNRGILHPSQWKSDTLMFSYDGADAIERRTLIRFSAIPSKAERSDAIFELLLPPAGRSEMSVSFVVSENKLSESEERATASTLTRRNAFLREEDKTLTQVRTDNPVLNQILDRSLRDLAMLRSTLGNAEYFAAGVPWYATLFGRDSIITAMQMLAFNSGIAEQTIRLFAAYQGAEVNPWRDEEPGKILHELRVGEMANLNEIPHTPYYGSIDATPLWLMLIGQHAAWTGDLRVFHELRPNIEAALHWIDEFGDFDRNGYVEYQCKSEGGLVNQGWKDSGDGIVNADGSLGAPPIALVEVQAYVYRAKTDIASLFLLSGDENRAATLRSEAQKLRERLNRDFWINDGYFALALQKEERRVEVLSSNAGHALWCGIADEEHAQQLAEQLLSPQMFSGWGIRTLSKKSLGYNPLGYHTGTVWPHDNSLIAAGLKRYGFEQAALRVFNAMTDAAKCFPSFRLPELFGGAERQGDNAPVTYPIACQPQAWAAGAIPFMLTTLLGLEPEAFENRLRIVRSILPENVNHIEVRNLSVGRTSIDLVFERKKAAAQVGVLSLSGNLNVAVDS